MGSSVEPGLPNIVVIPRARKRSKLASLTVGIGAPYLPASSSGSGRCRYGGHDQAGQDRCREAPRGYALRANLEAFFALILIAFGAWAVSQAGAERGDRRGRSTRAAGSCRSRPRSPTKRATWSTAASSPTCAGSPNTSRSTSPTATRGRCRAAAGAPAATAATPATPTTTTASPSTSSPRAAGRNATAAGSRSRGSRAGPSRARTNPVRPSAGSATTATPATAAATTSTSPGTTPRWPSSRSPNGSKSCRPATST